jgi:hypothetical protein
MAMLSRLAGYGNAAQISATAVSLRRRLTRKGVGDRLKLKHGTTTGRANL